MSRLTSEITLADVDEWFKIGNKSGPKDVKTVPRSATGGRYFDPKTQRPIEVKTEKDMYIPPYQRNPYDPSKRDYAVLYQREEERELMSNAYAMNEENHGKKFEHTDLDSIASTSVALPDDAMAENATSVYKNYNFTHEYEKNLPITAHKDQVIGTIETNQVTVIQGSTGSGKTTQVPQYILDHYAKQNRYCNIIVTQPRRIAAMSIARRVCNERGWQLGSLCGYQVGLDKQASPDTRILYVTTGVLLRKLVKTKNMIQFTHVILDEVHERDQDTDFSLLIVRKLLRTNSRHVKVVLMSATFDSDLFGQYFSLPIRGHLEPAPVVSVEGKAYKVSEFYADDLKLIGEIPPLKENDPEISYEAFTMATRLIEEFDTFEIKTQGRSDTGFAKFRGTVLVFLPGFAEIQAMEQRLSAIKHDHNLKIIPLHSTITVEEQILVFDVPKDGERKVILSTNIAESSITVPDIKYVIDFCLTKNLLCDQDTNYTSLQVEWASKANCIQRKGRAGRVSNGRVYRMITRYFWDTYIPNYGIPEMQRCPLDHLILQTKMFDMGEPKAMLALALSPPNLDDIERTILMLKEVGALSTFSSKMQARGFENRHDGELTFVGRVLADLPVDIRIGKMLILGHVFGFLEDCLIIAAAMSLKSIFSNPFKNRLQAYRHKLDWARGSFSDSFAILNAYKEYEWRKNMGEFRRGQSEKEWCHRHFLQPRRLRQVTELIKELGDRLSEFNIVRPRQRPNYVNSFTEDEEKLLLKMVLCGAFYPNYFLNGEIQEESSLREMSGHDPHRTVMVKGLPANQGTLYKEALEDHFREVGNNPTVYFEETRAYIQFQWRREHQGRVHPGVYQAIKMRHMNIPLSIELFPTDVAHSMMQKIKEQQNTNNSNKGLRSNRLTASDDKKLEAPMPDTSKTFVLLVITHIEECGHFWAQYQEEQNYNQLRTVQSNLNQGVMLQPIDRVRVGMYVAAPFKDEDNIEYYRARVESLERKEMRNGGYRDVVEVFFVDYGNTEKVRKEELRVLNQHLLNIPLQAVECFLSEVRPSPVKCSYGRWTKEASEWFSAMTMGKSLYAQVYSTVRNTLRVELIEPLANGRQVSVNKELINMEYADPAEESFLSKQDHEFRKSEAILGPKAKEEEENYQDHWLRVALSSAVSLGGSSSGNKKRGSRTTLRGPHSPYEMTFSSMTNNGRLRNARIEPDSVNSVSIDDEPQFPNARMMVAGFVGLNPSGSVMIARDTTIMPSIPGLPALVTLLFAPMVEFRTDQKKKQFVGAICGLGVDGLSDQPALPDHDIEVSFDTRIDLEDIHRINGVRLAINIAVGSKMTVSSWAGDAIFKIQENARRKLIGLIQKRRMPIEPYNYERPYRWNQVDPEDIIPHGLDGALGEEPVLLNFHQAISLVEDECFQDEDDEGVSEMRRHAEWLKQAAKDFSKRDPIFCELCNKTCQTPQLLSLHLETRQHKEKEDKLYT